MYGQKTEESRHVVVAAALMIAWCPPHLDFSVHVLQTPHPKKRAALLQPSALGQSSYLAYCGLLEDGPRGEPETGPPLVAGPAPKFNSNCPRVHLEPGLVLGFFF